MDKVIELFSDGARTGVGWFRGRATVPATQDARAEMGWLIDRVNVHEMAHSWFGDLIVCRDYAHAWLKESWATYMESCWLEDEVSRDAHLCNMYSAAQPAVEARLDRGLLPRAVEQAYLALGAQREAAPLARLIEASAVEGRGGFAQAGALRALGSTRRPEAVPVLKERLAFGAIDRRARPAGAEVLGELARRIDRRAEEQATELLVDLLRDPDSGTRRGAADGLAAARAKQFAAALEAYRDALSAQERVHIDRILDRLRGDADHAVARADKRIDALTDQLKDLESRLLELEARHRS